MSEPYPPIPDPAQVPDRSVKVAHLVMGLIFLGLAGTWALVAGEVITADRLALVGPAVLIAAGILGLVASLASGRNRRHQASSVSHPSEEIR